MDSIDLVPRASLPSSWSATVPMKKRSSKGSNINNEQSIVTVTVGKRVPRRRTWTAEEDAKCFEAVQAQLTGLKNDEEHIDWRSVCVAMNRTRSTKQCRERWRLKLNPELSLSAWSEEEDKILISLQKTLGNNWVGISKHIPGRSEHSCKSRWRGVLREMKRNGIPFSNLDSEATTPKILKTNFVTEKKNPPTVVRPDSVSPVLESTPPCPASTPRKRLAEEMEERSPIFVKKQKPNDSNNSSLTSSPDSIMNSGHSLNVTSTLPQIAMSPLFNFPSQANQTNNWNLISPFYGTNMNLTQPFCRSFLFKEALLNFQLQQRTILTQMQMNVNRNIF